MFTGNSSQCEKAMKMNFKNKPKREEIERPLFVCVFIKIFIAKLLELISNLAKQLDSRSICKSQLYFYILAENKLK